jgi:hypothetical protein
VLAYTPDGAALTVGMSNGAVAVLQVSQTYRSDCSCIECGSHCSVSTLLLLFFVCLCLFRLYRKMAVFLQPQGAPAQVLSITSLTLRYHVLLCACIVLILGSLMIYQSTYVHGSTLKCLSQHWLTLLTVR